MHSRPTASPLLDWCHCCASCSTWCSWPVAAAAAATTGLEAARSIAAITYFCCGRSSCAQQRAVLSWLKLKLGCCMAGGTGLQLHTHLGYSGCHRAHCLKQRARQRWIGRKVWAPLSNYGHVGNVAGDQGMAPCSLDSSLQSLPVRCTHAGHLALAAGTTGMLCQ